MKRVRSDLYTLRRAAREGRGRVCVKGVLPKSFDGRASVLASPNIFGSLRKSGLARTLALPVYGVGQHALNIHPALKSGRCGDWGWYLRLHHN